MSDCPACSQAMTATLQATARCRACGGSDGEEGMGPLRWQKVRGVCTPYHRLCALPQENVEGALL